MKIDCHAHVFNLNFIPIAGSIRGMSHATIGVRLPHFICNAVERYFHRITVDPVRQAEVRGLSYDHIADQIAAEFRLFSTLPLATETYLGMREDVIINEIKEYYSDVTIGEISGEINGANKLSLPPTLTIGEALEGRKEKWMNQTLAADAVSGILIGSVIAWAIKVLYRHFLKPYIDWFMFMARPYAEISTELHNTYPEIGLFIHHDMDMANWYEPAPPKYYPYETAQVDRISSLTKNSNGRLIPFYAYDPKKGIAALKTAINTKGYLGVKFYPASGYKPFGDEYQNANIELYEYCQEKRIPVFTHCNHSGMMAFKGAGLNSDPRYWEQVLQQFPNLILCFGHAGGEEGWFNEGFQSRDAHDFSQKVYELCVKYPHAYCDMGYFPLIVKNKKLDILRQNLLALFAKPIDGVNIKYDFSKKILYGSDWHMLMQEHGFKEYLHFFDKLFNAPEHKVYYDRFFYQNTVRYLSLSEYIARNKDNFLSAEAYSHLSKFITAPVVAGEELMAN
jgi:predicted TIM-barrel fold metal-dependent hydrolase